VKKLPHLSICVYFRDVFSLLNFNGGIEAAAQARRGSGNEGGPAGAYCGDGHRTWRGYTVRGTTGDDAVPTDATRAQPQSPQ